MPRKKSGGELELLHEIAALANQSRDPEQVIRHCLERAAAYHGWSFGHAVLPATSNPEELVPTYVYYPDGAERFAPFREATLAQRFYPGEDLAGRIFQSGQPEWTGDLSRDLVEERAIVAKKLGILAAMGFPVLIGKKVAAVLEFFSDRPVRPDETISETMVSIGMQVGRVIERVAFEGHLLTISELAQRRIAQDLHDDVGQELTGLALKMETLVDMLDGKKKAHELARDVMIAIDRTRGKIRAVSRGIYPAELDAGMLPSALGQLARTTTEGSRVRCVLECARHDLVLDSWMALHLYRIAQEAISNAIRHGGAHNISIGVELQEEVVTLSVIDDGTGLPAAESRKGGMGLRIMQHRARLIGGLMEIGPGESGGTRIVCRVGVEGAEGIAN
jgi:signal transduction histidine kinase